ncbi:DAHL domain-containing protein [Marinobacterium sedimentorum]|uniref:DAHL domain-containing protein n=1 Tax=Marinobacterium sedimentorum TaxID=2927804 RepID=UPI0020C6860A|nr:DAHL domain-containing protein [Marinobacterium sedimentorum]MCP8688419.1 ATP-binding protein [Marinobacterium sedimentorum]
MKMPLQLRTASLGLVFAALLVFLYIKNPAYDATAYFESIALLRQIKQLDARWELDALKSKIGVNTSYDPLVNPLSELDRLREQVNRLGIQQLQGTAADWNRSFGAYQDITEHKTSLIEGFKTHNAVLRNSLAFLPTAASDVQDAIYHLAHQEQGGKREALEHIAAQVDSVLLSSLVFSQADTEGKVSEIITELDELAAVSGSLPPAIVSGLEIFMAHVRTLIDEKKRVNGLLSGITSVPVAAHIDDLEYLLSQEQQQAAARTLQYRQYLLFLSAILAGLLLYVASRLVRSYAVINRVNQQLQTANDSLEQRVQERTLELQQAQGKLVDSARQAGMAEIATNVLHNVGNVLNSVNISAELTMRQVRTSKVQGLARAMQMLNQHATDLGDFITHDDKGKLLPGYLNQLAEALQTEQQSILDELGQLSRSVDHIKEIVSTQQAYAGAANLVEPLQIGSLIEDALRMNNSALDRHQVTVVKQFSEVPVLLLDKHRLLLILINLISNAKNAMADLAEHARTLTLSVTMVDTDTLQIGVQDDGEGIEPDNLTRIFTHGFSTRKDGHGFGLHSCAVAAMEMGGSLKAHSDGPGKGALFTLALPCQTEESTL